MTEEFGEWRAGADARPGAGAGGAGREAGEWWLDEAVELWFTYLGPVVARDKDPVALAAWVRAQFALPDGSPAEEVL